MTAHAANRINQLLRRYKEPTYLEIGVFRGETFFEVEAHDKVAVDPHFRFPRPQYERGTSFYETTSDEYFLSEAKNRVFDLVFLDGLHTFEQTFRDFCNTLTHVHKNSIIIIDDTMPSDPFSAIRDQQLAVKRRREHGGTSGAWHGDTFKTVLAIHDFFPQFSYATVTDQGNPQTVVWRESRPLTPAHPRMEDIGLCNYFEFLEKRKLFNPTNTPGLYKLLDNALSSL